MKAPTQMFARIASAALAVLCSLGILVVLSHQLAPARLLASPHVVEFDRVIVQAPAAPVIGSGSRAIATN